MGPVWLENVLAHQPQRWLPPGYSSYDELLTAAVEDAVNDASATSALALWKWGRVHRSGHHPSLLEPLPYAEKRRRPGKPAAVRR